MKGRERTGAGEGEAACGGAVCSGAAGVRMRMVWRGVAGERVRV